MALLKNTSFGAVFMHGKTLKRERIVLVVEKQADSLMRLSEKCYGAALTGALGAPAFHWLQTSRQGAMDGAFVSYAVLLVVCAFAGITLQGKARKLYKTVRT